MLLRRSTVQPDLRKTGAKNDSLLEEVPSFGKAWAMSPKMNASVVLTPSAQVKQRFFAVGGFADNKLEVQEDGRLSDDGKSYDLDKLSKEMNEITDEDVMEHLASKHRFKDNSKVFHMAIIDYLQDWNANKKMELIAKSEILRNEPEIISAMHPTPYGDRFLSFMKKEVFD